MGVEFRESLLLAGIELRRVVVARLHAGQARIDIGDESRLGLLAVIHDVDAAIGLAPDHFGNGFANRLGEDRRIGGAFGHHFRQRVGPGQASDMGGEDAPLPCFVDAHGGSPPVWRI